MIARSVSTFKARQRSPLGARERFTGMMGMRASRQGDQMTKVFQGSPSSLEWTHTRHNLRQDWREGTRHFRVVDTAGDHTVQWALVVEFTEPVWTWYLAELSEHSDHILRMRKLEYAEHPYDYWRVGGTADVLWLMGQWDGADHVTRSDFRGLSPDDWSTMVPVSPGILDPVSPGFYMLGVQGTLDHIYYFTTGGAFGFGRPPRIGIIDPRTWQVIASRDIPGARGSGDGTWSHYVSGFAGNGLSCWLVCRIMGRVPPNYPDYVEFTMLDHDTLEAMRVHTKPGVRHGGYYYWTNLTVS